MLGHFFASLRLLYRRHYARPERIMLELVISGAMLGRLIRDLLRFGFARRWDQRVRLPALGAATLPAGQHARGISCQSGSHAKWSVRQV